MKDIQFESFHFKPKAKPSETMEVVSKLLPLKPVMVLESNPSGSTSHSLENFIDQAKLKLGERNMLKALAQFSDGLTRERIKTIVGISSPTTFSTYKQNLLRFRYIEGNDDLFKITSSGLTQVDSVDTLPTDPHGLLSLWSEKFKKGCSEMLKVLFNAYTNNENALTRDELMRRTGISSPTTFSTYKQELVRNDLVVENNETYGFNYKLNAESFGM